MKTPRPIRTAAKADETIEASSGNVFSDLGFDDAEAQVFALRADLMAQLARCWASAKRASPK